MTKKEIIYNRILGITMVLSVISVILLIVTLLYAVTISAIDCSEIVCKVDSSESLLKVSIWMFLIFAVIFIVVARIMLRLISSDRHLEDAESYKAKVKNDREGSALVEAKLKELTEAKLKKEKELEAKRLEQKAIEDAKKMQREREEKEEKARKDKLIAEAKIAEARKEKALLEEKEAKEKALLEEKEAKEKEEIVENDEVKEEVKNEVVIDTKAEQLELPIEKEEQTSITHKPSKSKIQKRTKIDIIEFIESQTGISKNKSNKFLKYFAEIVKEELSRGEDVEIQGFGKFTTIKMPAKKAVNPQTNMEITVPEHKQARLRFDDDFKAKIEAAEFEIKEDVKEIQTELPIEEVKEEKIELPIEDLKETVAPKPIKNKVGKKTKLDIIEAIEKDTGISKNKSNKFLKFFAEVVKEELSKGEDVTIEGFGMFTTIKMPAKKAMNPQTNKEIIVPEHKQARLRFDDEFKNRF